MVMGVCGASKVNNWTVFDSLDLTSQQQEQEKGLLGRTDRGPTKTIEKPLDPMVEQVPFHQWQWSVVTLETIDLWRW